ncbi:lipopolysaccharide biosynthesis protein [Nocardioides sp. GCM10027113]|uniref:lipopolysaccharide biosynthesis protein n=1 Tax=unclassified Nocardioides TaxID=2615069 RepID=UPI003623F8AC
MVDIRTGTGAPGPPADLRRLARGSSANLGGSVVAALLNIVLPVVVTRSLDQQDAGLFFQAIALFTILLNTGTIGADTGVLRMLPRALVLERRGDLRRYLVVALLPALAFGVLLTLATLLLAGPLSRGLTDDPETAETFRTVLLVLLPWVPVGVLYSITMSTSRGLGSVVPLVVVEKIGRHALETGAVALALALGASVALVVLAWVAPYLAMVVVVAAWVRRRVRRATSRVRNDRPQHAPRAWRDLAEEFWRFSAPRALARVFTVLQQRVDVLVVGALLGPADAAVYAAATRFLVLGQMLVQSIQQVMAPTISARLAVDDRARAEAIYRTTTAWLTLMSWPLYLTAILFSPLLIGIFGPGYVEGATTVSVLCAAMLVATACGPVDTVLLMEGRSVLSVVNTGLALAVDVVLILLLVPRLGIVGAALAWAVAILVKNLLPLWQVNRYLSLHPLGPATRSAMAATVTSFGVVAGACALVLGRGLTGFTVAALLATATYAALVWRRLDVLEGEALLAVLRRRQRADQRPDQRP